MTATIASSSKATPPATSPRAISLTLAGLAESRQVPLAQAAADLSSLAERDVCAGGVAFAKVLQSGRHEQIPLFRAVFRGVVG